MRSYTPGDEWDEKELARLEPQPWMVKQLELNPEYVHWGPGEDYMDGVDEQRGWGSGIEKDGWGEGPFELDNLNEAVHFYFAIHRESFDCALCKKGVTIEAQELKESLGLPFWYRPTDEHLIVLHRERRFHLPEGVEPTIENLRANVQPKGIMVDAITEHVLLEHECKKAGIWHICNACGGAGYIYADDHPAYLSLIVWLLHPRKGASRGMTVKNITQEDLPKVYAFLAHAAKRNAERFEKVVAEASKRI